MECPLCGYVLGPFETECARCHGRGMAATTPNIQVTQQLPAAGIARNQATGNRQRQYVLLVAAVGYTIAALPPWDLVELPWLQAGLSRPWGIGFVAFLSAGTLAAMLEIAMAAPSVRLPPVAVAGLSICCLICASVELAHVAAYLRSAPQAVAPLYFELPILFGCSIIMTTVAMAQLAPRQRATMLVVSIPVLVGVTIAAAVRGSQSADLWQPGTVTTDLGMGWPWPGATSRAPDSRPDIAITVYSWSYAETLPTDGTLFGPLSADPGRVFLVCDIGVRYGGKVGSLTVSPGSFVLIATNQQAYDSQAEFIPPPTISLIQATLLPGGTARGHVVFEVDRGAGVREVRYRPGLF